MLFEFSRSLRPTVHLLQNTRKRLQNAKNKKCIAGYFTLLFCILRAPFFAFHIAQYFTPRLTFGCKVKGFCGLFFRDINKTWNSHEIRKVYNECFVFCGVFRKNTREIPVKCEIWTVYSHPQKINVMKKF